MKNRSASAMPAQITRAKLVKRKRRKQPPGRETGNTGNSILRWGWETSKNFLMKQQEKKERRAARTSEEEKEEGTLLKSSRWRGDSYRRSKNGSSAVKAGGSSGSAGKTRSGTIMSGPCNKGG